MTVPDYFGFFIWGFYMFMYTVCMKKINLHNSVTQFFLGNVDTFLDPKIRQLYFPGG